VVQAQARVKNFFEVAQFPPEEDKYHAPIPAHQFKMQISKCKMKNKNAKFFLRKNIIFTFYIFILIFDPPAGGLIFDLFYRSFVFIRFLFVSIRVLTI